MYVCVQSHCCIAVKIKKSLSGRGRGYSFIEAIQVCAAPKGRVFHRFGLCIDFGLESGMVFEGTTAVFGRIYRFNSK